MLCIFVIEAVSGMLFLNEIELKQQESTSSGQYKVDNFFLIAEISRRVSGEIVSAPRKVDE